MDNPLRDLPGAREIRDPQAEMEHFAAQRARMGLYHAEAVRDGGYWSICVPRIARSTQARTLDEIEPMTRDLIAVMDGIPAGSFDLEVTLVFPADTETP